MQNAKDTFYEMLQGRLAALNPERTIVVRGTVRPGVVVDENELVTALTATDCFHVRWADGKVDVHGALPGVQMTCAIEYETAGTGLNGGMDRGRALAAMDGEIVAALMLSPKHVVKQDYSGLVSGVGAVPTGTQIWWGPPVPGKVTVKDDRVGRTVTVEVMSYQEAGEL